ncbi:MAG TPA: MATE family efflux transporter [Candidatus Eisenbacteria bacterium]|jgi:putative MATE family efflux protein
MHDLTTGSVSRHLLKTTSFMLVTMLLQTLYYLVDLYWVGRLGKEAVAAVGVSGNLMFLVLALSQMLGVGTTTLVSHAAGRKQHERALLVFNQALVLATISGVLFFLLAIALRMPYVHALSADTESAGLAADYLKWFLPAMALQFPMVAMSAALRGTGNFKPGVVVQAATVILNMILAPILIFGWFTHRPLGVAGAALATLIAITVGSLWLTLYFRPKDAYLRFVPADFRPDVGLWGSLLKIGLPAGAEFALMAVYLFAVYILSRPFGAAAQAGFGIGMRILQAGFMPVVALGFSVAPVAGQNFGARRPERVRETFRSAILMSVGAMLVFGALCQIAPAAMIRFFSPDPEVIGVGEEYLRIVSFNFVASGVVFVCSSTFQAMGNTIPSLMTSLARVTVVIVPAFLLSRVPGFALRWVWYLTVVSVALQMTLSLLLVRLEFRKRLAFEPVPQPAPAPAPAS